MRLARSSRPLRGTFVLPFSAFVALSLCVACGGGSARPPTVAPSPSAAVASPTRLSLSSPVPAATNTGSNGTSSGSTQTGPPPSSSPAASGGAGSQTYTVQSGDTLLSIAQQFYGDSAQWRKIYDANKDAIGPDPDALKLDQKLTIPPKDS